ncbi:MAG: UDP-N-acetylmuramate dehydrogenase [Halanaerobiales bacterium]|nr:UDP-N-acetylmuramate dehydrogenase [Halanaerobiales bacterium]
MFKKLSTELEKLRDVVVQYHTPLKDYTSFRIGGPADIFLIPLQNRVLPEIIAILNNYQQDFFILGKGSNIIVGDQGIRGVVIYNARLNNIIIKDGQITAECGVTLAALAKQAMEAGLSGLEFASGIPGSLGGAIFMNAGAYGSEMKDIIVEVDVINNTGDVLTLNKQQLDLSYRHSILQEKSLIASRVKLKLAPGDREQIKAQMKKLNQQRQEKQPLEWPSAGSVFKRPDGYYTGPLIEKAGLKGARVGDAQVSQKHAGFIINRGNATARDVIELIKKVQREVYQNSGIKLETEPRYIGEF